MRCYGALFIEWGEQLCWFSFVVGTKGRPFALGHEIRNRGDVYLFWGVDPNQRYPRFLSRYALEPVGTQVPEGRAGRFVIAVNIGARY